MLQTIFCSNHFSVWLNNLPASSLYHQNVLSIYHQFIVKVLSVYKQQRLSIEFKLLTRINMHVCWEGNELLIKLFHFDLLMYSKYFDSLSLSLILLFVNKKRLGWYLNSNLNTVHVPRSCSSCIVTFQFPIRFYSLFWDFNLCSRLMPKSGHVYMWFIFIIKWPVVWDKSSKLKCTAYMYPVLELCSGSIYVWAKWKRQC